MLARAERKGLAPDSPLRTELTEVRQITHNTLEKMRSLSAQHASAFSVIDGLQRQSVGMR